MEAPEDKSIFEKIVAGVTEEEIEFMKIFEIDDGDGTIDSKEFIILTVVRIGAAPPQLINQIHARFDILDRQHKGKISYDDLILGRKKKVENASSFRGMLRTMTSSRKLIVNDDDRSNKGDSITSAPVTSSPSAGRLSQLNARLERVNSINKLKMTRQQVGGGVSRSPRNSMENHDENHKAVKKTEMQGVSPRGSARDSKIYPERFEGDIETGSCGSGSSSDSTPMQRGRSLTETEIFEEPLLPKSVSYQDMEQNSEPEPEPEQAYVTNERAPRQNSLCRSVSECNTEEKKKDHKAKIDDSFRSLRSFEDENDLDKETNGDQRKHKPTGRSSQYDSTDNLPLTASSSISKQPKTKRTSWHRMETLNNLLPSSLRNNSSSIVTPHKLGGQPKSSTMSTLISSNNTSSSTSRQFIMEISNPVQNKEVLDKLQKAKELMEARQLQNKADANNKATLLLTSKQAVQSLFKNAYFFCFAAW